MEPCPFQLARSFSFQSELVFQKLSQTKTHIASLLRDDSILIQKITDFYNPYAQIESSVSYKKLSPYCNSTTLDIALHPYQQTLAVLKDDTKFSFFDFLPRKIAKYSLNSIFMCLPIKLFVYDNFNTNILLSRSSNNFLSIDINKEECISGRMKWDTLIAYSEPVFIKQVNENVLCCVESSGVLNFIDKRSGKSEKQIFLPRKILKNSMQGNYFYSENFKFSNFELNNILVTNESHNFCVVDARTGMIKEYVEGEVNYTCSNFIGGSRWYLGDDSGGIGEYENGYVNNIHTLEHGVSEIHMINDMKRMVVVDRRITSFYNY